MDEKLGTAMNDGRLVHAAEHVIYPLINEMIQNRILMSIGKFQNGEKEFVADVAYIAGLREIEHELKSMQAKGTRAFEKMNGLEKTPEIIIPKNI